MGVGGSSVISMGSGDKWGKGLGERELRWGLEELLGWLMIRMTFIRERTETGYKYQAKPEI